jgi:hypothetical protein
MLKNKKILNFNSPSYNLEGQRWFKIVEGWVEERNPTKDRLTQPMNEPWPMLEPSPN